MRKGARLYDVGLIMRIKNIINVQHFPCFRSPWGECSGIQLIQLCQISLQKWWNEKLYKQNSGIANSKKVAANGNYNFKDIYYKCNLEF